MRNLTLTTGKYPTNLRESLTQAFGEISLNTRILLLAAVAALAAIGFIFMAQFMLWQVALLVIAAWTPLVVQRCLLLLKRDCKLVVWFGLLVAQTPHMGEHCAQMVQIHLLGWPWMQSHGIIGGALLDQEWMHFWFDSVLIPFATGYLLCLYGLKTNRWLWILLPLALWHCVEHISIVDMYIKTGVPGFPGLLAHGGLIWPNSPISRPDLHFTYNLFEEALIALGYRHDLMRSSEPSRCAARYGQKGEHAR